jgi:hypothetical protein
MELDLSSQDSRGITVIRRQRRRSAHRCCTSVAPLLHHLLHLCCTSQMKTRMASRMATWMATRMATRMAARMATRMVTRMVTRMAAQITVRRRHGRARAALLPAATAVTPLLGPAGRRRPCAVRRQAARAPRSAAWLTAGQALARVPAVPRAAPAPGRSLARWADGAARSRCFFAGGRARAGGAGRGGDGRRGSWRWARDARPLGRRVDGLGRVASGEAEAAQQPVHVSRGAATQRTQAMLHDNAARRLLESLAPLPPPL